MDERPVNLLFIDDNDTNHYCFIKDFGKLVGSQYSSDNHKTYVCRFCLHGFPRAYRVQDRSRPRRTGEEMEVRLKEHEERCFALASQRTEFPNDPVLKFENIEKKVEAPFTVYADFASILKQW